MTMNGFNLMIKLGSIIVSLFVKFLFSHQFLFCDERDSKGRAALTENSHMLKVRVLAYALEHDWFSSLVYLHMVIRALQLVYSANGGCNLRQYFIFYHYGVTEENISLKHRHSLVDLYLVYLLSLRYTAFVPWPSFYVER